MGIVDLAIHKPGHQQTFCGPTEASTVRLLGEVLSSGTLFLKWYSSLSASTKGVIGTALDQTVSLGLGSHVITFTAKDKDDAGIPDNQLMALYQTVVNSGMAGGPPPEAESPCVIHVFLANMISPRPTGPMPTLSKASSTLEAEAPVLWGKPRLDPPPPGPPYSFNEDYHQHNKIRYRWIFRSGATTIADLVPAPATLIFDINADDIPLVRYVGGLPAALVVGNLYTLALRVENKDDATQGHEVTRQIRIGV